MRRRILLLVVLGNLVPLLGVLSFEWHLSTVLFVYWIEWGTVLLLFTVQALLARRIRLPVKGGRRNLRLRTKRGSFSIICSDLAVPVGNVSTLIQGFVLFPIWLLFAVLFVYPNSYVHYVTLDTAGAVMIGVVVVSLPHLYQTVTYIRNRRFEYASPERLLSAPAWYTMLFIGGCVVVLSSIDREAAALGERQYLLLGVSGLVVWTVARASVYWHLDRLADPIDRPVDLFDHQQQNSTVVYNQEVTHVDIEQPETDPQWTIQPKPVGALFDVVGGPYRLLGRDKLIVPLCFVVIAVINVVFFLSTSNPDFLFPVIVGLLGAYVLIPLPATIHELLVNCSLEYQCHDQRLVCYDRWLEEPQWELPYGSIQAVRSRRPLVGKLLGFGHVRIETDDAHPADLWYVSNPESAERLLHDLGETRTLK